MNFTERTMMWSNYVTSCVSLLTVLRSVSSTFMYVKKPKVIAKYGQSQVLEFYSNFIIGSHKFTFKSIYIEITIPVNKTVIATGGTASFTLQDPNPFGNRLVGYRVATSSKYVLEIAELTFDDSNIFRAHCVYLKYNTTKPLLSETTQIELVVQGGPQPFGGSLPPTTDVTIASSPIISNILSGNPKPGVTWKIDDKPLKRNTSVPKGRFRYNFMVTLPAVTSSMCGKVVSFLAEGHSGIDISGRTTLNVIFTPSIKLLYNYRMNSSCLRVEWVLIDMGLCTGLVYEIEYLSNASLILHASKHSQSVSKHTYCPVNVGVVTLARIKASYKTRVSDWAQSMVSPTPPPSLLTLAPPTAAAARTGNDDDDEVGAIIGGVIGGLFLIFLIILICCCCGCCACCVCCACCGCGKKKKEEEDKAFHVRTRETCCPWCPWCWCCCRKREKRIGRGDITTRHDSFGYHYNKNDSKKNLTQTIKNEPRLPNISELTNESTVDGPVVVYGTVQREKPVEYGIVQKEKNVTPHGSVKKTPNVVYQGSLKTNEPNVVYQGSLKTKEPNVVYQGSLKTKEPNVVYQGSLKTKEPNVVYQGSLKTKEPNVVHLNNNEPNIVYPNNQPNVVYPDNQPNVVYPNNQPNVLYTSNQPNVLYPNKEPNTVYRSSSDPNLYQGRVPIQPTIMHHGSLRKEPRVMYPISVQNEPNVVYDGNIRRKVSVVEEEAKEKRIQQLNTFAPSRFDTKNSSLRSSTSGYSDNRFDNDDNVSVMI